MSAAAPHSYLILGATGGVGSELTRRLAQSGASVFAVGRNEDALAELSREDRVTPAAIECVTTAVITEMAEAAVASFGRLDGLANCIGSLLLKPAHLTTDAEWEETMRTNTLSAFAAVKAAAKTMPDGGSVVLVSSAASRIGLANHEAIAAAKAAVSGLARSAAATYASRNLRVNCVAPGLVRTPLTERITSNERSAVYSTSLHALKQFGRPDEVASAIQWLLDPQNEWVTGQEIGVDGGLATLRSA